MLFFSKRKELENRYYDWVKENKVADCPFNVITFMSAHGLIDEEKALEFLKEKKNENANCD